ncbi:putative autotransporter adhesin-like protein [Aquimarina sp. MAR_2010_214]|uniref:head GIN domain-containing protein n=1 Tax=Aquimarina sp. MAR_2010_214 TaxID=1250026 RepID=UPI000C714832|nr:head GIN domain-containing protein [Aquimarina sp. MAR_2010_214]PKV50341.1 putative autotransporter adhesin-like protein [Aquimarina sp. MAR_2010_214]
MTTLAKIIITFCLSALCCSCNVVFNGVKGQGEVIRKERTINQDFDAIKASKGLDVILVNNSDQKVIVEANKNLHEHIEVYVEGNTLYVTSDQNIYYADEKNVFVSYDKINKVYVNSGASISSEEAVVQKNLDLSATSGADIKLRVKAETITTSVTSGAMMDLTGKVNNHKANATSGADIRAEDLLSLVSEARATSGASIKIHAKNEFTGKATSGADVVYYGKPEKVSETDNSGGNVRGH